MLGLSILFCRRIACSGIICIKISCTSLGGKSLVLFFFLNHFSTLGHLANLSITNKIKNKTIVARTANHPIQIALKHPTKTEKIILLLLRLVYL